MPNVIWSSTSKVKDGRGAEAVERAQKLKQLFKDAGAVNARYFQSTAGPNAPANIFVLEARSLAHLEELFGKLQTDSWFQTTYGASTDQPSTQIAQGISVEIE